MKKKEMDNQIMEMLLKKNHKHDMNPTEWEEEPNFHSKFIKTSTQNNTGIGSEQALLNEHDKSIEEPRSGQINTLDVITIDESMLQNAKNSRLNEFNFESHVPRNKSKWIAS